MLPAGRSWVRFPMGSWGFFIELILPGVSESSINYGSTRGISWGVKVAGA